MKKFILLSFIAPMGLGMFAQTADWGGVTIIEETYAQKISRSGEWVVGTPVDGGTVVYNTITGNASYYPTGDYGTGYVVSDNGWVVGCELEDGGSNHAVIMSDGKIWTPDVFDPSVTSNIHSITPDGSRICGVVGGVRGFDNVPFYCDIDAAGNVGAVTLLPYPDKDLFGAHPQYVTATWISTDGKTIAGQVKDSRGYVLYPILYTENSAGEWTYSLPSEGIFNPQGVQIPEPVKEMEEVFPDAPYPEIQDFMTAQQYSAFELAGEPWEALATYMDEDKFYEYLDAEEKYLEAQIAYNEMFEEYNSAYWRIFDSSVTFVQNGMALSADGKWLASSAKVFEMLDAFNDVEYYVPYLCNLETLEWRKIGPDRQNMITDQVLPGGDVIYNQVASDISPAETYIYLRSLNESMDISDYIKEDNPEYYEWLNTYVVGDLIVGEDENGYLIFDDNVAFNGQVSVSDDFSVMVGGVPAYILDNNNMTYFSYVFTNVISGVEAIEADAAFNGVYTVFNLQGVKVLQTKNVEDVKALNKGIYIVNGKKVAL